MHTTTRQSDQLLWILFLILVVWIPLPLGSNRAWAWHLLELTSFILAGSWYRLRLQNKVRVSDPLRHSRWLLAPMLGFAAVIVLQLIPLPSNLTASLRWLDPAIETGAWTPVSTDPYISWIHLRTTLGFTCLGFLTVALTNSRERLKILATTIVISGVFQGVYGSLMTLSGVEYGFFIKKEGFIGVATGTFWNRNHLANYLVLAISCGTGLLLAGLYQTKANSWRERSRRLLQTLLSSKTLIRLGLAMMVITLVLTKSRMGNFSFFSSLILSGFVWLWLTRRLTKGSILLLVSLIVIDSLIVGAWFGIDKVKERMETTAFSEESRDEVNRDTWQLILDQPILGSGAGSYYTTFPRYRQDDIHLYYDHAHNDYFELLAEHGILGCLPLLLLIGMAMTKAIATMRQRKTLLFQAIAFAPMMAITAMIMHSTVDFNLQIPANAATFVIILAMAWVTRHLPSSTSRNSSSR